MLKKVLALGAASSSVLCPHLARDPRPVLSGKAQYFPGVLVLRRFREFRGFGQLLEVLVVLVASGGSGS